MSGMAGMALAWGAEGGESQGGTDRTTCENARQKARPFTITIAWFSVFQPPFPLFYCSSLSLFLSPVASCTDFSPASLSTLHRPRLPRRWGGRIFYRAWKGELGDGIFPRHNASRLSREAQQKVTGRARRLKRETGRKREGKGKRRRESSCEPRRCE